MYRSQTLWLLYATLVFVLLQLLTLSAQKSKNPLDYVRLFTGTSNSRWMLFPGPTLPFGMVKLSPDNQDNVWNGGYEYTIGSIAGFSHLHAMSLSGLSVMPVRGNIELYPGQIKTFPGASDGPFAGMWTAGYRSRIDKTSESASPGYYGVTLLDYGIRAELSATTRTGWLRFTYPQCNDAKILLNFNFPVEERNEILDVQVHKVNAQEIEGLVAQRNKYAGSHIVHFVMRFSKPFRAAQTWKTSPYSGRDSSYGLAWRDQQVLLPFEDRVQDPQTGGLILHFSTAEQEQILLKTGLSFVSIDQARKNLEGETDTLGWDFDGVVGQARAAWSELLSSVQVDDPNEENKAKFYTALYRAYAGKSILSDLDGTYMDMFEKPRKLGPRADAIYSADSFWGTQWNNTPLWTLLTPKVANSWVNHMLEMYDVGGWIADAPTGFEYAPIMDAQHHIALIVSAYQKGVRNFDVAKAWLAIKHGLTTAAETPASGGQVGSRSLAAYLKYGYVPDEDGPSSNTLEYAFDDYMAAQLALALGKTEDYHYFMKRSQSFRQHFDPKTRYMRRKTREGVFVEPFDPFYFGCDGGWNGSGFMEGNAWLYTYYVPQDLPALVELMGRDTFVGRLEAGFRQNHVDMGNQPNLQAPFLFNYAGKPWLTQYHSRYVLDHYYDLSPYRGWQGEEDEGQLSSLFVLMAMGLFQMDGGCKSDSPYDLSAPLFRKITLRLDQAYYGGKTFVIEAKNNSAKHVYIQSAHLNGKPLNTPFIKHSELVKGGKLVLQMGPRPNEGWFK
jgi:predicted alpha-1,2-mannosidase